MVSFVPVGRMGNFLFECATAYAYAKRHMLEFSVPLYTNDEFHCPIYLRHLVNKNYDPRKETFQIVERQHQYMDLPFYETWRGANITLYGYWQTEKYFKEYRAEILDAFGYKWEPELGTVSIHVRRGDYLAYTDKHPKVPDEYYHNAIEHFVQRGFYRYKVFSDDIPWCKAYFTSDKFSGVEFVFSEGNSIEEDLRQGTCCLHHINSSSTYSWWMAWLNRNANKEVITPKEWFTPGFGNLDTSDIIPDNWIKM